MTAATLLANLTSRGVVLTQVDGDIQVETPKGELTAIDIQIIKGHKSELLDLLEVPSCWDEYHDAITRAFANPSTREDIGPLWLTDPDGWPGSRPPAAKPAPGTCDRCGSDQHKDFPIHGGQSIRRDCAKCGRFISWPNWNPPQEPDLS
jgi:hypothetical protein